MTASPPRSHPLAAARWYSRLAVVAEIDLRGLAAFRVLLGALLLANLGERLAHFRAFYSDDGVYTAAQAWQGRYCPDFTEPSLFQPMAVLGDRPGGWLLFAAGAVAAGMLILGWRTFAGSLIAWLAVLGLDNRNLNVLNGGDDLFRLLLFWSLFLPLGARWSLDSRRRARPWNARCSNSFASGATLALLTQLALMYFVTAVFKSYRLWVVEGSSLYFALHVEPYVSPLGHTIRGLLPLTLLSRLTWWLELVGPLALFSPIHTAPLRYLLFAAFAGLHLGIELLMPVGLFSYVALSAWVVTLPRGFWDRVESYLPRRPAARVRTSRQRPAGMQGWLAGVFLVYVLAWNVWSLDATAAWFPPPVRWVGHQLKIHQLWIMFAPSPPPSSTWLEARGTTLQGQDVALRLDGRPADRRPAYISQALTERWRKWSECIFDRGDETLARQYAFYLLREARRSDPTITSARLVLIDKPTAPPGGTPDPPTETILARCDAESH